eukprot:IDg22617t1
MRGYQLGALKPTPIFEFLDWFYLGCRGANLSEQEAFAMIKDFLLGKAKAQYNSVVLLTGQAQVFQITALRSIALLEAAEREESTIKAIFGSATKRNIPAMLGTKATTLRKIAGSTAAIVALQYEQDDLNMEEMFYSNEYSVLTEELPSTDKGSERTQ